MAYPTSWANMTSAPTTPPTSRRYKGKVIDCNVRLLDDTVHAVRLPVSYASSYIPDYVV